MYCILITYHIFLFYIKKELVLVRSIICCNFILSNNKNKVMKGKKMLALAVLLTGIAFVGCKDTKATETTETEQTATTTETETAVKDEHTSENSLDWAGTYEGILPGANSDIKTTVVLNQDKTYAKTTIYVDKAEEKFEEKGTFTWNAEGTIVTLVAEGESTQYKVQEGSLLMLDQEGKEVTGPLADKYVLAKK